MSTKSSKKEGTCIPCAPEGLMFLVPHIATSKEGGCWMLLRKYWTFRSKY